MVGAQETNGWGPGSQWLGPRKATVGESRKSMNGAQQTHAWDLRNRCLVPRKAIARAHEKITVLGSRKSMAAAQDMAGGQETTGWGTGYQWLGSG